MSDKKSDKKKKGGKVKGKGAFVHDKKALERVLQTPDGQMKDMSGDMLDEYHPVIVEATWDKWWEAQGYYRPDEKSDKEPYVMVLPPPNVTGTLHLGHALTCSVEDCLMRWKRMQGYNVLWVPGTDHAGIATQVVVEKLIAKEGLTRHDLGREKFLERVWKYKEAKQSTIHSQLRRMGSSLDWSRCAFTMDECRQTAVTEAFIRMFEKGHIFRANRLVNWSCTLRTAISDIEVDHIDLSGPTELSVPGYADKVLFGVLHQFAYKVKDDADGAEIVVATTRIETMLGDTGLAVHPDDERYKRFHGKFVVHPFIKDRVIPVVTDGELVDPTFGTGAVKITPAHDHNDFKCGVKHNLPRINILNDAGNINENGGEFQGMHRFECRVNIIEALQNLGLYRGEPLPNPMVLGRCSRSKDIVEPVLRPQWWVDCDHMAARAVSAVETGALKLHPSAFNKTWYNWLVNSQDWCISRQLWWGHRIPAWWYDIPDSEVQIPADAADADGRSIDPRWIVAKNDDDARAKALERFPQIDDGKYSLSQDPDVLDTWFSSGLFPFSVMNWPTQTTDLSKFYPGSILETGHDILFFWVARMVMMGLELTDNLPFTDVYLHAMVRDKMGRKMSKSLGNVIDPIDVINGVTLKALQDGLLRGNLDAAEVKRAQDNQAVEYPNGIAECGADALRFALLSYTTQARDINLDTLRIVGYRQFCNKLWNAIKFGLKYLPDDFVAPTDDELVNRVSPNFNDTWIRSRLAYCIKDVNEKLSAYDFASATLALHQFWLKELCGVFVELSKPLFNSKDTDEDTVHRQRCGQHTLWLCYNYGLRLLHPVMPFVTEELYQRLPGAATAGGPSIMIAQYPKVENTASWYSTEVEAAMDLALEIAHCVNSVRASLSINTERVPMVFEAFTDDVAKLVGIYHNEIATLSSCTECTLIAQGADAPAKSVEAPVGSVGRGHLIVAGLDMNLDSQLLKLDKQLESLDTQLEKLTTLMASATYERVPQKQRDKNTKRAEELKSEVQNTHDAMDKMRGLMDAENVARVNITLELARRKRVITKVTKRLKQKRKDLDALEKKLATAAAAAAAGDENGGDASSGASDGKKKKKSKKPMTEEQKAKAQKQADELREAIAEQAAALSALEEEYAKVEASAAAT